MTEHESCILNVDELAEVAHAHVPPQTIVLQLLAQSYVYVLATLRIDGRLQAQPGGA